LKVKGNEVAIKLIFWTNYASEGYLSRIRLRILNERMAFHSLWISW